MRILFLWAFLVLFNACTANRQVSNRSAEASDRSMKLDGVDVAGWADNPQVSMAASASVAPRVLAAPVAMKAMVKRSDGYAGGMAEESAPEPEARPQPAGTQERMVFHEGWIHLRSTDPTRTLDSASKLAQSLGGYVESRYQNASVLRIPVKVFRSSFDSFVALGSLQRKEIRTDDITDQFHDNELRLRVAKETLERLQTLLAESQNPDEKLRLLREIQRLSKQIELQEATKRDLEKKASFSRLNLNVDPFIFEGMEQAEPIGAFQWISALRPLRLNESLVGEPLERKAPTGFVSLELEETQNYWAAAANDGSEIWAHQKENEPEGDALFWQEALRIRLSKGFAKTELRDAKDWKLLLFTSYDAKPYTWLIAVRVEEDELHVVEGLFPNPDALSQHLDSVLASLQEATP